MNQRDLLWLNHLVKTAQEKLRRSDAHTLLGAINQVFTLDYPQHEAAFRSAVTKRLQEWNSLRPRPFRDCTDQHEPSTPPFIITDEMRREAEKLAALYDPPDD